MAAASTVGIDTDDELLRPDGELLRPQQAWLSRPIAFLATTKSLGGLERLALRLASDLSHRGADVRMICRPSSPLAKECDDLSLSKHEQTIKNSADYAGAKALADFLVGQAIGILHVHSRRDFVPAVLAVKLAGKKMKQRTTLVLHVHQIRRLGDGGPLSDFFFNWGADQVLAVSAAVERRIVHRSFLRRSLVKVLPNGVDVRQFPDPQSNTALVSRAQMRRSWSIPDDVRVIGMVGRLDQKGQSFVISNMRALLSLVPDLRIVFIGPEGKPGTIATLKALAASRGIKERVVISGMINDMPAAYAAIDLLLHLPIDEAFGLAVAEAMASSLPVIASNIGGCKELIRNNETGLLIKPRKAEQLVDAVRSILGKSKHEVAVDFGAAARESIVSSYSVEQQVESLIGIYEDVVTRTDGPSDY